VEVTEFPKRRELSSPSKKQHRKQSRKEGPTRKEWGNRFSTVIRVRKDDQDNSKKKGQKTSAHGLSNQKSLVLRRKEEKKAGPVRTKTESKENKVTRFFVVREITSKKINAVT